VGKLVVCEVVPLRILWLGWEDAYTPTRMSAAAQSLGVEIKTLDIVDVSFIAADSVNGVFYQGQDLVAAFDVLIARTFFPHISETLTVARLFREAGKTVIDQSLTDEGFVVSKMHDYLVLAQHGIAVPRTWQAYDPREVENQAEALGYPCVLKGMHGSHGDHVHLVHDAGELQRRLLNYPPGELLLQEYLPAAQDYRLLVIGYRALPMMVSRVPADGDFRTNVGLSHLARSHQVADYDGLGAMAEASARTLRREFAGIDIRYFKGKPLILEVNRRPSFENYEAITGMDVAGCFLKYVTHKIKMGMQTQYG
jgi:glutathione synthase/RimK-type ligase-like ATP-grasp enzyme